MDFPKRTKPVRPVAPPIDTLVRWDISFVARDNPRLKGSDVTVSSPDEAQAREQFEKRNPKYLVSEISKANPQMPDLFSADLLKRPWL